MTTSTREVVPIRRALRGYLALAGGLVGAMTLGAVLPAGPVRATEVVQALPDPNAARLGDALTRLGYDQNDLGALIDAGNAARELGDYEASKGFFERAHKLAPADPRIATGQARTALLSGDPVSAISLFDTAERNGANAAQMASDRGLALDMVGDSAGAQRRYAQALAASDDAQVRQRMAVSQAISGDLEASEQTLMPLLRKQDKPAWRTRAFTLAIAGDTKEAIALAERILPDPLGKEVAPYLRYMPRLTSAQQAAAANLGRFPRSSEIGRDSARIAGYVPERRSSADTALIPSGEALDSDRGSSSTGGRKTVGSLRTTSASAARARGRDNGAERSRKDREKDKARAASERVAPPDPKPGIEAVPGEQPASAPGSLRREPSGELPPLAQTGASGVRASTPSPAPKPAPRPAMQASAAQTAPGQTAPAQTGTTAAPGFDLARASATRAPTSAAVPASAPAPAPAPSLSEAFSDLGKPSHVTGRSAGAVDLSTITPARAAPPPPPEKPKPKPPAHPSRIWVQIGVSRDKAAIAYDWRRYQRRMPELFKDREAHVTPMGQTNRILVGPFATARAANDFVGDFAKAGNGGALVWTSPAGQVVDELESAK